MLKLFTGDCSRIYQNLAQDSAVFCPLKKETWTLVDGQANHPKNQPTKNGLWFLIKIVVGSYKIWLPSVFCYTLAKWLIKLVLFFCYLESKSSDLLCFDHLIIQYLACSLTPSQINQINLAGSGHLCLRVFKNLSLEQHKIKQCYGYIFIIKQQSQCLPGVFSYTERVELYFAANYVEADFEVATFLALIGGRCIWRAEEFGR